MNTLILPPPKTINKQTPVPNTPRGRALHTVDWFMNGQPVLRDHDNPCLTLKNGMSC